MVVLYVTYDPTLKPPHGLVLAGLDADEVEGFEASPDFGASAFFEVSEPPPQALNRLAAMARTHKMYNLWVFIRTPASPA